MKRTLISVLNYAERNSRILAPLISPILPIRKRSWNVSLPSGIVFMFSYRPTHWDDILRKFRKTKHHGPPHVCSGKPCFMFIFYLMVKCPYLSYTETIFLPTDCIIPLEMSLLCSNHKNIYSSILKNLRMDSPRLVNLCRTKFPS